MLDAHSGQSGGIRASSTSHHPSKTNPHSSAAWPRVFETEPRIQMGSGALFAVRDVFNLPSYRVLVKQLHGSQRGRTIQAFILALTTKRNDTHTEQSMVARATPRTVQIAGDASTSASPNALVSSVTCTSPPASDNETATEEASELSLLLLGRLSLSLFIESVILTELRPIMAAKSARLPPSISQQPLGYERAPGLSWKIWDETPALGVTENARCAGDLCEGSQHASQSGNENDDGDMLTESK